MFLDIFSGAGIKVVNILLDIFSGAGIKVVNILLDIFSEVCWWID
jgi:hypothetical protein